MSSTRCIELTVALNSPTKTWIAPSGRLRILGFGVGSSEGIFVTQEGLEIMMALDSAKGIVLNVHEKKGDLQQGTGNSRDACPYVA